MEDALQSSVYVSSPEFAGWLMKKGFRWRKLWKKRWVALHGAEIVYMDMEPTVDNAASMTITKAEITSASVIDRDDADGDPNGFAIHINDGNQPTWHLRAETVREKKSWIMRLMHVHAIVRWLEDFEKVRVLGVGGTGIVYELLHKTNGSRFAMKEMEIKNRTQMKMAVSEAVMLKDIMENVSHPNIMHIERVFQVGSKFYMVFPLCTGGELYEHIIKRGHFTEHDAARITRDLVSGLHALHEHDILHLDIKPENILFDSNDEDAKIKITDFGLSKMFSTEDQTRQNNAFSMKLMQDKLGAFLESGETYKEQLRGTIGYMSPELILTGHCSKATDVFAAGVVLYILLCGRPPFNSKSNREVLERTAKGVYKISGGEWDAISSDAKDLVQRMLQSNPLERITTAQILAHPWLQHLDEDNDEVGELDATIAVNHLMANNNSSNSNSYGIDLNHDTSFSKHLSARISNNNSRKRSTGANLVGALRQLSGHVKQRRSEKMATNLSRIVSSLLQQQQAGGARKSTLAAEYLIPVDGSGGRSRSGASSPKSRGRSNNNDQLSETDADLLVLNSDFRTALVRALSQIDELEEGHLTIEQFAAILTQLIGVNGVSLSTLLVGRFVDRDGDGYISADDIFAMQAMLMQQSEVFLRQIAFRVYTESLWYPGRQFNLINAKQQIPRKSFGDLSATVGGVGAGAGGTGGTPIKITSAETSSDVVEPPKQITARHVAAVFEKMGYDPAAGTKVFSLLLDLLAKERARQLEERNEEQLQEGIAASLAEAEGANSAAIAAASAGANSGANSSANTSANAGANAGADVIAGIAAAASAAVPALTVEEEEEDQAQARMSEAAVRDSFFNTPLYARKPRTSSFTAALPFGSSNSGNASAKIDVADFVRIVELDDILVQAFTRRARLRMQGLMREAEDRCAALKKQRQVPAHAAVAATTSASAGAATNITPIDIASDMLTEMFKGAFQQCKSSANNKATPRQLFP